MKLTHKQAAELIKVITAQVVELVPDESTEAEKDFNAQKTMDTFLASRKPVFQKEFEDSILPERMKSFAGEIGGKLKGYVRKASGNVIKLSDMEGKTDDEVVGMLATHLESTKDADATTLREQIKTLVDDHKKEIELIKTQHGDALTTEQKKFNEMKVDEFLQGIVKGLPLGKGDPAARARALKAGISDKYAYVWNEDKKAVELREKDKPESPVIKDNMVVEPTAFAKDYFSSLGMVEGDLSKHNAGDALGDKDLERKAADNAAQYGTMNSMAPDLAGAIKSIETAQ